MARKSKHLERYIVSKTLKSGKVAYYFEPPKDAIEAGVCHRMALGNSYSEAKIVAASCNIKIDDWRAGKKKNLLARPGRYSLDGLRVRYMNSTQFIKLRPTTKRCYMHCMELALNTEIGKKKVRLGSIDVRRIRRSHVDALYKLFLGDELNPKISQANNIMRVLRRMYNLGMRWLNIEDNPFSQCELISSEKRHVFWSEEEERAFISSCRELRLGNVERAFVLARETGLRVKDVVSLKWEVINSDSITVKVSKTNVRINLPLTDRLLEMMNEVVPVSEVNPDFYVLHEEDPSRPHRRARLAQDFAKARERALISSDLKMMDLRGTLLMEVALAGGTEDELMSLSGHKTRGSLSHYINRQPELAASAMRKLARYRDQKRRK